MKRDEWMKWNEMKIKWYEMHELKGNDMKIRIEWNWNEMAWNDIEWNEMKRMK